MTKIRKILFFGLGSIGIRHLKLIKKNYDFEIYAYRSKKGNPVNGIINIYNFSEALQINPDIAFITNPTHLHIETALMCLKAGIKNLFIEKPISHSLKDLDLLGNKSRKRNSLIYIGYNLRHNPVIKRLMELVENIKEDIFFSQTMCSSYLPNWRLGLDYRNTYSAKKAEGGGVILDLSHEFDYNEMLFGKIQTVEGYYGKISNLEIDSEDYCDAIVKFENGINAFIHLDYFSRINQRNIRIIAANKEIYADLLNNEIIIKDDMGEKKESFNFELDDVYEEQLKYFINGVEKQIKNISNLGNTIELIKKLISFKNTCK